MPLPTSTYSYSGWLAPTDDLLNPFWTIRTFPALVLLSLVLGTLVFKDGFWHGACLGFGGGLLVSLTAICFQITEFTLRRPERSDVDNLPITQ